MTTTNKSNKLFTVSGSAIIPGTRKLVTVPPIKVSAATKEEASKSVAPYLCEKFAKDLPHGHTFSAGFALHHLNGLRPVTTA